MFANTALCLIILSTVAVNLVVLALIGPMRAMLNTRCLGAKKRVKERHPGYREYYYVYKVRRRGEHGVVMLGAVLLGDIFAFICIYGYSTDPSNLGLFFWSLLASSLTFSLVVPLLIHLNGLKERVQVLAVSEDYLELWYVLGDHVHQTMKITWPEIEDVDLSNHNYADFFFVPWILPRFFPRDYDISITSGSWNIEIDAKWPNAMRLLSDMIKRCPNSENWYELERMRKEVEKWKEEGGHDLVTPS